jgi:hypothetical protein
LASWPSTPPPVMPCLLVCGDVPNLHEAGEQYLVPDLPDRP